MKDVYAVGLGVGGFALGCLAVALFEADKVKTMDNKLTGICKGMDFIKDNISLDVPEETAKALVRNAAQNIANDAVTKASLEAVKDIKTEINNRIKIVVNDAYDNVESEVRNKLESQINLQTIEKIQNSVSEKVAKQIVDSSLFAGRGGSSKDDIIKTCVANGMDAWDIRRILEASK